MLQPDKSLITKRICSNPLYQLLPLMWALCMDHSRSLLQLRRHLRKRLSEFCHHSTTKVLMEFSHKYLLPHYGSILQRLKLCWQIELPQHQGCLCIPNLSWRILKLTWLIHSTIHHHYCIDLQWDHNWESMFHHQLTYKRSLNSIQTSI